MKKVFLIACCWSFVVGSYGQTIQQKLQKAYEQFESDSQLKHAISSLYVIDAKTGKVIFDKNSQIGLAGASTQKIITASTAFELLGKDYRYKTEFYNLKVGKSDLHIVPSGDPTFGSWRWSFTNVDSILDNLINALSKRGIQSIRNIFIDNSGWDTENIPDGWIWQDIGNYYGAGAHKLNYRENQYNIILKSGKAIDDSVGIVSLTPQEATIKSDRLQSKLVSANKESGDNAYVYLPDGDYYEYRIRGTIPVNENNFSISASTTDPEWMFSATLLNRLQKEKQFNIGQGIFDVLNKKIYDSANLNPIYTHYSPTLDSIIYWFLKRSINLYGEALVKTFAYEKQGFGSTDSGVVIVKNFWKEKGLDEDELHMVDGSGLSPLNRITTHAQVEILKYAKTKDWFLYFYDALPEYNGMKMKSGTINGVKGFCGYQTSKDGNDYIFSFLVNNYNGSPSALVDKMYRVLNVLK